MSTDDKIDRLTKEWAEDLREEVSRIRVYKHATTRYEEYLIIIQQHEDTPAQMLCARALLEAGADETDVLNAINAASSEIMIWKE